MTISSWSTTASDNDDADATINWLENQAPSTVNNSSRAMMAAIRSWYEDVEWRNLGHTVTRTAATTFTIAADVTTSYLANRPIRCIDTSTLYGYIASASYSSPNTTVTVTLDSGSLTASLSSVALGFDPTTAKASIPTGAIKLPSGVSWSISSPVIVNDTSARNVCIAASVNSNALTISLVGFDGNTPSSTNVGRIPFRNVTVATGTPTWVDVSAANTLVISSGSSLGTTNDVPFRIWVVAFNDGGTIRVSAIQCSNTSGVFGLSLTAIASSTAEGGAGGADTAKIFYTGTAVTSKAYYVLGFLEWSSGLAAAGTWSSGPTIIQNYYPGMPLPGTQRQIQYVIKSDTTSLSSTSFVDITGVAAPITPSSVVNKVKVETTIGYSAAQADGTFIYFVVDRGGTDILTGDAASNRTRITAQGNPTNAEEISTICFSGIDSPYSVSSLTYQIQAALEAGTLYINRSESDTDSSAFSRCISTVMLTEIEG